MNASNSIILAPPQGTGFPYPIQRTAVFIKEIGKGALIGGAIWGVIQLLIKTGLKSAIPGKAVEFLPYMLAGAISKGIFQTAAVICEMGRSLLGEPSQFENLATEKSSAFETFRNQSWRVIGTFEKIPSAIDGIYSHIFGIRTAKQMNDDKIFERDLYQESRPDLMPRVVEIFRRAILESIDETIKITVPKVIAIKAVTAAGYSLIGSQWLVYFIAISLFAGVAMGIYKISFFQTYEKMGAEMIKCFQWSKAEFCYKFLLVFDLLFMTKKISVWEGYICALLNQPNTDWKGLKNWFRLSQPDNPAALAGYAFILCQEGHENEAEQLVAKALERDSENLWLLSACASILYKQGKRTEAQKAEEKALAIKHPAKSINRAVNLMIGHFDQPVEQPVN